LALTSETSVVAFTRLWKHFAVLFPVRTTLEKLLVQ